MKSLRFKVNFELPLKYEDVVWGIYGYLVKNPEVIDKNKTQKIFTKDIYQFAVDCAMDVLELEFNKKYVDIEIVEKNGSGLKKYEIRMDTDPEFRKEEYILAGKMTTAQLDEYEKDYKPDGLSIQEYFSLKEL